MLYAKGKRAKGVCDMCGQVYLRNDLKREVYNQKTTGFLVCEDCWDEDNPQLQLGRTPIIDPIALFNPRPDTNVLVSRDLMGFNPVGNPSTCLNGVMGRLSVNGVRMNAVSYNPVSSYTYPASAQVYAADAVHLDGASYLSIASMTSSVSPFFSWSGWVKFDTIVGSGGPTLWVADPTNLYLAAFYVSQTTTAISSLTSQFYNASGSAYYNLNPASSYVTGSWHHILVSVDVTNAAGSRAGKIYIDDTDVTVVGAQAGAGFNVAFNGLRVTVGADTFGGDFIKGDVADIWLAPGVTLLDGSGDIPEATRRLFISATGKPVTPANFPAGAAALFSGNASAFGANQGTGGAFTTIGALTNATTSPSD